MTLANPTGSYTLDNSRVHLNRVFSEVGAGLGLSPTFLLNLFLTERSVPAKRAAVRLSPRPRAML